jgi:uncharacterized protein
MTRVLAAPADLSIDGIVRVPERVDVELSLRLESVLEGVLVSGTVHAPFVAECVRCLDHIDGVADAKFQELYVYPERADSLEAGVDYEQARVEGDMIDLAQPALDAVVLELPPSPVCRPDCPGLCSVCGARLVDVPAHVHDTVDPRWAALTGLLDSEMNESGSARAGLREES